MVALSTVEARNQFADLINRVAYGKERVVLTRRGKALVAVVPIEDMQLLEAAIKSMARSPELDVIEASSFLGSMYTELESGRSQGHV